MPGADDKTDKERAFPETVGAKAGRKLQTKKQVKRSAWTGLSFFGLVGWSVVLPTLIGASVGQLIDANRETSTSWTLALLLAGLCVGCLNAWIWIEKERSKDD